MRMKSCRVRVTRLALLCAAALAPLSSGQSLEILPPNNATVNGGSSNSIPLGAAPGGTFMVLYDPSQLVGLPIGGTITSLRMRLANFETAPWPPAGTTISDYEIRIGTSNRTSATMSETFAANLNGAVLVRDGALNLAAGAYPGGVNAGSTPEAWGPVVDFTTPYTYTGGPLVLEFRNTGTAPGTHFADAVATPVGASARGTTSSPTSTEGLSAFPIVVQLGVTPPNTQTVTLPNANDALSGLVGGGNSIPLGVFTDGRHMSLYAADQFAAVPRGSLITGMQLRLRNEETSGWPGADSTNADYEVWLSQSALDPNSMSNTYANNQLNPVRVRDGALLLPANVYPAGAASGTTPEPWGPLIAFDKPYVYQGGTLAIDIQSAGGIMPVSFADTVASSAAATGKTASPRNAATGAGASAFIVRLSYIPPVESPFGEGVTKIYALKDYAGTPAPSQQSVLSLNVSYASEFVYAPEQFQTVGPGTLLTALSLRKNDTAPWPAAPTTATSYSIDLSRSLNGPATLSTTVANNVGPDNTTVRSGSLSVLAGEMAAATPGGTAPFTWQIPFSTPYSYRSGSLLGVFRNTGFASPGDVDAIAFNAPEIGVQTKGFFSNPSNTATTTFVANVPVMRFSADAQVIVPNSTKDGAGLGAFYISNSPYDSVDSTIQYVLASSELSYVPLGGLITSLSFLADTSQSAWPGVTGAHADDFSVEISTAANRPLTASFTYANNVGSDAVIVRSGPISWLPGSLPAGSTGRYGGTITFDRAFVYKGGDLCITVRQSGVTNGGIRVRAANPATVTRAIRSNGKTATLGNYFGIDGGSAIQLGYIPSAVTPKSELLALQGSGRFLFVGGRTFQMLYNADQITVPIGATINGVSFTLGGSLNTAFPPTELTIDRFDITMSSATRDAANASTTFASNEGADVTTVRSGPITIPPNAYPGAQSNGGFGLFIPFTRPFVYKGGPLSMLLRVGATSGANPQVNFAATPNGASGIRNTTSADALTGTSQDVGITARFAFTDDAFCPWDLNNDGVVDDLDFQIFVVSYNILDCADAAMALGCSSDFTHDGIVNDDDFLPFVQAYNAVLCP